MTARGVAWVERQRGVKGIKVFACALQHPVSPPADMCGKIAHLLKNLFTQGLLPASEI